MFLHLELFEIYVASISERFAVGFIIVFYVYLRFSYIRPPLPYTYRSFLPTLQLQLNQRDYTHTYCDTYTDVR